MVGSPDLGTVTVCHAERFFLTKRQQNKRCARKTLAYSKRWDSHALMASIQKFIFSMCRKNEPIGKTPSVALGVTDRRWSLEDVVTMTGENPRAKEDAAFEAASTSKFAEKPSTRRTYTPRKLKTPSYLDRESGVRRA